MAASSVASSHISEVRRRRGAEIISKVLGIVALLVLGYAAKKYSRANARESKKRRHAGTLIEEIPM
jgi:hypothetical protein